MGKGGYGLTYQEVYEMENLTVSDRNRKNRKSYKKNVEIVGASGERGRAKAAQ